MVDPQETISCTTANDAADKAIRVVVFSLPADPSQDWKNVIGTQPLVEDYIEVKSLERLF